MRGVDTSAIIVNWAMAVQDEIRNQVGKKGRATEGDIDKLEYQKVVIKETFRLHPAAPLLLPRETMSYWKINHYNIHPKTVIQVNAWAIGRDPRYWKDPDQFFPEKFADSSVDFKGQFLSFCPLELVEEFPWYTHGNNNSRDCTCKFAVLFWLEITKWNAEGRSRYGRANRF